MNTRFMVEGFEESVLKMHDGYDTIKESFERMFSMMEMQMIQDFATKWINKFNDENVDYIELVDHYMADDCEQLGFKMDCGNAFCEKYGDAFNRCEELEKIINDITDISLLGSAIYSKWRYFNHWAYTGEEILEPKNREWFVMILKRMAELSNI